MARWKIIIPIGALLATLAVVAIGLRQEPDVAGPREVSVSFIKLSNAGDEKGVARLLLDDASPEREFFLAMARTAKAAHALDAACDRSFGMHETETHARSAEEMVSEIAQADVTVEQDSAHVKAEHGQTLVLVKKDGQWLINSPKSMAVFSKRAGAARELTDRVNGEGRVFLAMADRVEKHQYPAYIEARQEMDRRLAALPATPESMAKNVSAAQLTLHLMALDAESYRLEHAGYPPQEGGVQGLKAKDGPAKPKQDYDTYHHDPWGNAWVYRNPASTPAGYDVFSCGPDGKPDTPDDVRAPAENNP